MAAIIITIIISVTVGTMWALCAASKEDFEGEEEDEEDGDHGISIHALRKEGDLRQPRTDGRMGGNL